LEGRSVSYKFPGQTSLKMVHFSKDEDVATFLVSHVAELGNDFLLAKNMKERMPKQLAYEINSRNLFPADMPKSNMTFSRDFNLPINPPFSTFSQPNSQSSSKTTKPWKKKLQSRRRSKIRLTLPESSTKRRLTKLTKFPTKTKVWRLN